MFKNKYFVNDNDKFGSWLVISANKIKARSLCVCKCGLEKLVRTADLVTGRSKSCGKNICRTSFSDLVGLKFGYLVVNDMANGRYGNGSCMWNCTCICKKELVISSKHLLSGATKSCGCQRYRLINDTKGLLSEEERAINHLIDSYRRAASSRELCFELSKEKFKELITSNCFYCNCEPNKITVIKRLDNSIMFKHLGIDRKDSSYGYTIDNCVPCCWICNRAKLDMKYEEFVSWIINISNMDKSHLMLDEISNDNYNI